METRTTQPLAVFQMLALAVALVGPAAASGLCSGLEIRAGSMIFSDSFESGDVTVWSSPEPHFSATRVLDLDLEVQFSQELEVDHVLHLRLRTPKGHHYQTLDLPISSNLSLRGTSRRVEGYPRPLAVRVTVPSGVSPAAVSGQLPVAGTAIVSSSLYGRWEVEATLDDSSSPCARAGFFLHP